MQYHTAMTSVYVAMAFDIRCGLGFLSSDPLRHSRYLKYHYCHLIYDVVLNPVPHTPSDTHQVQVQVS